MKLSKIFAGMSAFALAASMLAVTASAEEAGGEEAATQAAYNLGFNIQFGHFYGGSVTIKATGAGVLNTYVGEDEKGTSIITTDGKVTGETTMLVADDWTGNQHLVPAENLEILDGTNSADNPGWNGMWIQCFTTSLDDIQITFEFDLNGATWKEMDPADEDFEGWIVLNAPNNAASNFPEIAQHKTDEIVTSYSCTLDAAGLKTLIDEGVISAPEVQVPVYEDDNGNGGGTSSDSENPSSEDPSSTDPSSADPSSSSKPSGGNGGNGGSGNGGTSGGSTSTATDAASDNTENAEAGAPAGIALALAAVAGAAIVVTRKK